mmetsp:Transcript_26653/g.68862  ORF Transcript_26653/g.68862 Transcript_26653/m.68862 type:complete len:238 (-) Transcript_26653:25-738(-)
MPRNSPMDARTSSSVIPGTSATLTSEVDAFRYATLFAGTAAISLVRDVLATSASSSKSSSWPAASRRKQSTYFFVRWSDMRKRLQSRHMIFSSFSISLKTIGLNTGTCIFRWPMCPGHATPAVSRRGMNRSPQVRQVGRPCETRSYGPRYSETKPPAMGCPNMSTVWGMVTSQFGPLILISSDADKNWKSTDFTSALRQCAPHGPVAMARPRADQPFCLAPLHGARSRPQPCRRMPL